MKGYKAFENDFTCKGFQYEVGKTYELEGRPSLCQYGFHFCEKMGDCFSYYDVEGSRYAEVEALGEIVGDDDKKVTNKIKIVREISKDEMLRLANEGHNNTGICNTGDRNTGNWNTGDGNTGNWNTGYWNTGNWNTGDGNTGNWNTGNWNTGDRNTGNWNTGNWNTGNWNTGYRNTGNWNTGNRNTGYWNTGDRNTGYWNVASHSTGCFNTETQPIMLFDKPSDWSIRNWFNSDACRILNAAPQEIDEVIWVPSSSMTDEEKKQYPSEQTTGGYLKTVHREADRQAWFDGLGQDAIDAVKALPNFDAEIFFKCTGIRVKD